MDTLNAGEVFRSECTNGNKAKLTVGQKLPQSEKALVKVLKVEGKSFTLGPLKAGPISIAISCGESIQEVSFTVQEMPQEAAANRYRPIGSEKIDYPLSFFILLGVILLSPLLAFLFYRLKKKKVLLKSVVVTKKDSPRILLEKQLFFLEGNISIPTPEHFHQLYKAVRKFIEKELNLKSKSLTTQEFLGTFRALALQQSANQALISQLEYILRTADDVRFANKFFTTELWKDYLQKVRAVFAAFPEKLTQEAPKGGKK